MRLIVLYKDGQRMECLDDIEQAHFYEDKVVTNKLPLNIRVIDFKKEDIASINCQDLNEDVVVRQKQEIEKLKQQLIEKEQELEDWKDGTIAEKLWHLERQLAEKEKQYNDFSIYEAKFRKTLGNWQNQVAIEQLEKVKKLYKNYYVTATVKHNENCSEKYNMITDFDVEFIINRQIKELKEKK